MTYEHIINCILFYKHSVVPSLTHRHIFQPFAIIKQLKFRIKDEQINVYLRQIWAGARCVASNGEHLFSELQIWYIWDVAQLITIYRWLSLILICMYGVCTWTSFLYGVAKHAAHIIFNCGIAGNRLYADSRAWRRMTRRCFCLINFHFSLDTHRIRSFFFSDLFALLERFGFFGCYCFIIFHRFTSCTFPPDPSNPPPSSLPLARIMC